jgi:hypothetical protein
VKRDRPGMSPNFIIYLSRVLVSVVSPILISCGTLLCCVLFILIIKLTKETRGRVWTWRDWRWRFTQCHLQLHFCATVHEYENKISCTPLSRIFFPDWDFSRGFLYVSLISPEGSAKLRWAERVKTH